MMKSFALLALLYLRQFDVVWGAEFPTSIQRCPAGDTVCLAGLITELMAGAAEGIPDLGLPAMDPLYFKEGTASQQDTGPVSMNLTIRDGHIHGWSRMKVEKVVGFGVDPKSSSFELYVSVPVDSIIGTYDLNGRALLIPVQSSGAINITFENLQMHVQFETSVIERDGEEYLQLDAVKVTPERVKKMHTQFDNLFSDKAISDNANSLMNQYDQPLFQEIRNSFGQSRSVLVLRILQPVFIQWPYKSWFKTDAS